MSPPRKDARVMKVRSLVAAVGVAAGALVAVPATASASLGECAANEFCLWEAAGYGGLIWHRSGVHGWLNFASSINDEGSAGANKRAYDSGFNVAANGAGVYFCYNENTSNSYVGDYWNDEFSSARNWSSAAVC